LDAGQSGPGAGIDRAMKDIELKLRELGLELPPAPRPAGNYVAATCVGNLLFLSGQFPIENGVARYTGRVGAELTEAEGYAAARLAALNVLAQIGAALNGFERLQSLVRVEGHVAAAPGWHNTPKVLDGASDLFAQVLGERGAHTRTAFNPPSLPWNLAVELVVTAAVRLDGRKQSETRIARIFAKKAFHGRKRR
jgi:enamine deaminase RidA (YjgF/YER057c/UK114 family)